jgi:hypothetical protein
MAESEFAARLRALGESRDQGVITEEEFALAKQQLLQAKSAPPVRSAATSYRNLEVLGYAFIAAAVAVIVVISFSSQEFFDFVSVTQISNILALAAAASCAVTGGRILQRKCVGDEVYLALPLMLAALVFPFLSFLGEIGVSTLNDIGALVQVLATLTVLVLLGMNWNQFGWTPNVKVTPELIVGAVGSVFLIIFVFVDAWTYQGRGYTYDIAIGSFWSDESIWTMLIALFLVVAFAIPTLVATSLDKWKIAFACAGATLAAILRWLYFFKGAIDGDFETTGKVAIFVIGVIATAALGVMQFVNLKKNEGATA